MSRRFERRILLVLLLTLADACKSDPIAEGVSFLDAAVAVAPSPQPDASGQPSQMPDPAPAPPDAGTPIVTTDASASAESGGGVDAGPGAADAALRDASSHAADSAVFDAEAGVLDASLDASLDAAAEASLTDGALADAGPRDAYVPDAGESASYPVGTVRLELVLGTTRTIPVQLWYPAVEAARSEASAGHPTAEFEPEGARRTQLTTMLANSPDDCTSKTMHAAHAPAVRAQTSPFPALVFSHCQDCVRFSTFTLAEHLAGLGFVVAAPDHVNGTIYDGTGLLDEAFLATRASDVRGVIDLLLDAQSSALPAGLRGRIDSARIAMFGHSYGSLTTGRVLRDDPRVKAGAMIAAPIDLGAPLDLILPSATHVADLKQPGMFLEAMKDTDLLNVFIEANYEAYPNASWLLQFKDAGHWSFTDIAGFNGTFADGCGAGFVDIAKARATTKAYLAAFFAAQLRGEAASATYLNTATPADLITLKHRP